MSLSNSYSFDKYFNNVKTDDGAEIVDFVDDSIMDHEWETIDQVARVSSYHENRLDFLSSELMEENIFWWVLLISNEEVDPFEGIQQGDLIISPKKSEIFDAFEEFK